MSGPLEAVISVGVDPTFELGPVTLAWHGLMIGIGIAVGALAAGRFARERGMSTAPLYELSGVIAGAGLVGGKVFYLAEHGALLEPAEWVASGGFTFNGGLIFAALAVVAYLRVVGADAAYVGVVAAGLPLGVAVGRIGDVINGEHYGPPSTWLLAVRNTHPDALVPSSDVSYHSGGMYEVLLGLVVFVLVWSLRHRLRPVVMLVWLVLGAFGLGRFLEFFLRSDSEEVAWGLSSGQWSSLLILAGALAGAVMTLRLDRGRAVPQYG